MRTAIVTVSVLIMITASVRADEPAEDSASDGADEEVSLIQNVTTPNDILERIRVGAEDRAGLFDQGPISLAYTPWKDFNRKLDEAIGLRLGFTYYSLVQFASGSVFGPGQGSAGDFDFFGRWTLIKGEDGARGTLGFNLEDRHAYGQIPPSDLDQSIGSIWRTTRGFSDSGFRFNQLWWHQRFLDDRVSFRLGVIDQKHFYDLYRYKSQKRYFVSFPLSDSPTIRFPSNGFGGVLRVSPLEDLHIVAGIGDANGTRRLTDVDTFFSESEFFTALDIAYTPTVAGLGAGRYSVTAWHTDARTDIDRPSGRGFNVLAEQEIAKGIVPFLRYGYGDGADLAVEHTVAAGVGFEKPFGNEDDVAGIGADWSRPSNGDLRDQWGIEGYYRFQLTPVIQVTPGFQVIVDPSSNPAEDVIRIFQFRVGVVF